MKVLKTFVRDLPWWVLSLWVGSSSLNTLLHGGPRALARGLLVPGTRANFDLVFACVAGAVFALLSALGEYHRERKRPEIPVDKAALRFSWWGAALGGLGGVTLCLVEDWLTSRPPDALIVIGLVVSGALAGMFFGDLVFGYITWVRQNAIRRAAIGSEGGVLVRIARLRQEAVWKASLRSGDGEERKPPPPPSGEQ